MICANNGCFRSKVTHLAMSLDGVALVSASYDGQVFVWHVLSKQIMKNFDHRDVITNLLVMAPPRGLSDDDEDSPMPVKNFRVPDLTEQDLLSKGVLFLPSTKKSASTLLSEFNSRILGYGKTDGAVSAEEQAGIEKFKEDIKKIKFINQQLYDFSVENIFKSAVQELQE